MSKLALSNGEIYLDLPIGDLDLFFATGMGDLD